MYHVPLRNVGKKKAKTHIIHQRDLVTFDGAINHDILVQIDFIPRTAVQ